MQRMYETCFKEWYTDKFLRGDRRPGCMDEWEVPPHPATVSLKRTVLYKLTRCRSTQDYKECMVESVTAKKLGHLLVDTPAQGASPNSSQKP